MKKMNNCSFFIFKYIYILIFINFSSENGSLIFNKFRLNENGMKIQSANF